MESPECSVATSSVTTTVRGGKPCAILSLLYLGVVPVARFKPAYSDAAVLLNREAQSPAN